MWTVYFRQDFKMTTSFTSNTNIFFLSKYKWSSTLRNFLERMSEKLRNSYVVWPHNIVEKIKVYQLTLRWQVIEEDCHRLCLQEVMHLKGEIHPWVSNMLIIGRQLSHNMIFVIQITYFSFVWKLRNVHTRVFKTTDVMKYRNKIKWTNWFVTNSLRRRVSK